MHTHALNSVFTSGGFGICFPWIFFFRFLIAQRQQKHQTVIFFSQENRYWFFALKEKVYLNGSRFLSENTKQKQNVSLDLKLNLFWILFYFSFENYQLFNSQYLQMERWWKLFFVLFFKNKISVCSWIDSGYCCCCCIVRNLNRVSFWIIFELMLK